MMLLTILRTAPMDELRQWTILVQALAVLGIYFSLCYGPISRIFWGRTHIASKKNGIAFTCGVILFFLTFGSPLDYLSDEASFGWHMLQHVSETMWMVPLLLLGVPKVFVTFLYLKLKPFFCLTHPVIAAVLFDVLFSLFHLPVLYNLTLRNDNVHFLEHTLFFSPLCVYGGQHY